MTTTSGRDGMATIAVARNTCDGGRADFEVMECFAERLGRMTSHQLEACVNWMHATAQPVIAARRRVEENERS